MRISTQFPFDFAFQIYYMFPLFGKKKNHIHIHVYVRKIYLCLCQILTFYIQTHICINILFIFLGYVYRRICIEYGCGLSINYMIYSIFGSSQTILPQNLICVFAIFSLSFRLVLALFSNLVTNLVIHVSLAFGILYNVIYITLIIIHTYYATLYNMYVYISIICTNNIVKNRSVEI